MKGPVDRPRLALAVNDEPGHSFASLWEFAVAVNRSDPAALTLAGDGTQSDIPIDGREVRRLLGTVWFRGVVPRLSPAWRERVLESLVRSAPVPDHVLKVDRRLMRLSQLSHEQLNDLFTKSYMAGEARADAELLLTVGKLWGAAALERFQFVAVSGDGERSRLTSVLKGFRK